MRPVQTALEKNLAFTVFQTTTGLSNVLAMTNTFSGVIIAFKAVIKLPLKRCGSPLLHSGSSARS